MPPNQITEEKCRQAFEESGEYRVLEYRGKGCKTKHLVKHLVCGYEYDAHYSDFINNHRCPYCAGIAPITEKNVVKRSKKVANINSWNTEEKVLKQNIL